VTHVLFFGGWWLFATVALLRVTSRDVWDIVQTTAVITTLAILAVLITR
jgi:hypothetical protein